MVVVDDPITDLLLWLTIAGDTLTTTFSLLSPKNVYTVRLIGVYTRDGTVLFILLIVLLSARRLYLGVELREDINILGVYTWSDSVKWNKSWTTIFVDIIMNNYFGYWSGKTHKSGGCTLTRDRSRVNKYSFIFRIANERIWEIIWYRLSLVI